MRFGREVRNRNRFAEREGTALSATNPGGDYAYIACHRRTKGATRPRPIRSSILHPLCVSRGQDGAKGGGWRRGPGARGQDGGAGRGQEGRGERERGCEKGCFTMNGTKDGRERSRQGQMACWGREGQSCVPSSYRVSPVFRFSCESVSLNLLRPETSRESRARSTFPRMNRCSGILTADGISRLNPTPNVWIFRVVEKNWLAPIDYRSWRVLDDRRDGSTYGRAMQDLSMMDRWLAETGHGVEREMGPRGLTGADNDRAASRSEDGPRWDQRSRLSGSLARPCGHREMLMD